MTAQSPETKEKGKNYETQTATMRDGVGGADALRDTTLRVDDRGSDGHSGRRESQSRSCVRGIIRRVKTQGTGKNTGPI